MEPIISPWFIYFAGIVNPLKFALGLIAFLGFVTCFIVGGYYYIESPCDGCGDEYNRRAETKQKGALKLLKIVGIMTIVSFMLQAFIPDKDTLIAMAVANIVTVDNIQGANDFVKTNVQDYVNMIVEAVNKVK